MVLYLLSNKLHGSGLFALSGWLSSEGSACNEGSQGRATRLVPGLKQIPWRRHVTTPVFLPESMDGGAWQARRNAGVTQRVLAQLSVIGMYTEHYWYLYLLFILDKTPHSFTYELHIDFGGTVYVLFHISIWHSHLYGD